MYFFCIFSYFLFLYVYACVYLCTTSVINIQINIIIIITNDYMIREPESKKNFEGT